MSIVYTTLTAAYRLWNDWLASQRKATVSFVEFIDEQEFGYVDHGFQAGLVVAPIMDAGAEVRIDPAIDAITWVWNEGRHFAQWQRYPMPAADACAAGIDRPEVAAPPDQFAGDDPFAAATRDIARGS